MKRIFYLTAVIALFCNVATGQKVKFGIKAGLNISQFTGDIEKNNFKSGLNAGVVAEVKFNERFSLQPELLYNRMGNKIIIDSFVGTDYEHREFFDNLDYLSLPVLFKIYVFKGLSIEAGPQISVLTGAKRKVKVEGDGGSGSIEYSSHADYKKTDMALVGGLAYDLPFGLFIQARYLGGISNIITYTDATLKNQTIAFSAGYKF